MPRYVWNSSNPIEISGITPLLTIPCRVPHPFNRKAFGISRHGPNIHNCWESYIFEYMATTGPPNYATLYPHLIMVTFNSCTGHDGWITHGELASIVTAMRNRAIQPAPEFFDAQEQMDCFEGQLNEHGSRIDPSRLAFKHERTFPVRVWLSRYDPATVNLSGILRSSWFPLLARNTRAFIMPASLIVNLSYASLPSMTLPLRRWSRLGFSRVCC